MSNNTQSIDRRDFIKKGLAVGAGAAVATAMPLSANDLTNGVCVELPPENAKTFNTTCQYCMVQCGYKVSVWEQGTGLKPKGSYTHTMSGEWISPQMITHAEVDGKQVYISVVPDKECVINEGDHSMRGGTNAQTLFHKNKPNAHKRLTKPMIRKDGYLTEVSWDEAIAFTAENLAKIKKDHGADSLALFWGDWLYSMPTHAILKLWFEGLESSSHAGNGWAFDEESSGVSWALGSGTRSFTVHDFEETKLLVTAGTNIWANGTVWYNRFLLKNGAAKQIVIDPRQSEMAIHAEKNGGLHLMLKPGTDYILATAITQEVLRQGKYDKAFVEKWVVGFDKVQKVAMDKKFSLSNAQKETGVPGAKIKAAANLMIENMGQTMVLHEKGIQHQMAAFENQFAYTTLGVILGNVGKAGACSSRAGGHPGGTWAWPKEPASREHNLDVFKSLREGKIKAVWSFGTNTYKQIPDLNKNIPLIAKTFFIVQDRVVTEMNQDADVIFPAASWGETNGVLTSVDRRVRVLEKFMDAPGDTKPDWWIVAQVAKKMGYSGFDWKDEFEVWDEIRSRSGDVKEMSWDMLKKAGTSGIQFPYVNGKSVTRLYSDEMEKLLGKRFFTKDNKIHLEHIEKVGALDHKNRDGFEWKGINKKYPLMVFDFRLDELWNTGYTYWDTPTISSRTKDNFMLINTADAKSRKIATDDWVIIESPYGNFKAKARVTDGVIKGSVGVVALFPKMDQEFNRATPPSVSPINGNFTTMVAAEVKKV